ncbi:MAG: DUF2949 domain-containing protein [Leptolyngbyaceae cyanobacterium bins.302]|nr:DUF2949 domain-containing protein [Leptolyngbyaceae cyanobacterium bins.302]
MESAAALVNFLKDDLCLPIESITLAWKQSEYTPSLLPMTLWQYGLISLGQLDQILDWLYHPHQNWDTL